MALKILSKKQRPRHAICTRWGYVFWGKAGDERKNDAVWDDGSSSFEAICKSKEYSKSQSEIKQRSRVQKEPRNQGKTPQFTKEQVKQEKGKKEMKYIGVDLAAGCDSVGVTTYEKKTVQIPNCPLVLKQFWLSVEKIRRLKKEKKKQNIARISGQTKEGEKFTKKWHQPKRK